MVEPASDSPPWSISPRAAAGLFGLAIACLTLASLAGQVLAHVFDHDHVFGLVGLFNLNTERNIPTWFASASLLAACALLWLISSVSRPAAGRERYYWRSLALVFLYLSIDEGVAIHERLNSLLRQDSFLPGFFFFGWVLAGIPTVVVLAALYVRFVLGLAPRVRRLFVLAASLFVGGALGIEMLGARVAYDVGTDNLGYALMTTAEEVLEMTGVAVFIYALLLELGRRKAVLFVRDS